jgi:aspartate aminotransferase-like enzyme
MSECKVLMTVEEYKELAEHEAVVITEYERANGERIGRIGFMGTVKECEYMQREGRIEAVLNDLTVIGNIIKTVDELIKPEEAI